MEKVYITQFYEVTIDLKCHNVHADGNKLNFTAQHAISQICTEN